MLAEFLDGSTTVEPASITQIIAGGAGSSIRDVTFDRWFTAGIFNADYSYLRLEIHGCRLRGQAFDTETDPSGPLGDGDPSGTRLSFLTPPGDPLGPLGDAT